MSRTLFPLLLAAALAPAAEPTPAQLKAAEGKLKAFRDKVGTPAVAPFTASDLSTAKDDKDKLPNAVKVFETATDKVPSLKQPAAILAGLAEEKVEGTRKQAAKTFLTALQAANPNAALNALEPVWKELNATKIGTVGEASGDFKLTAAELAKDVKAAKDRAARWQAAMEENAMRLDANRIALVSLAARAKINHESLAPAGKNIDQFIQTGMVATFSKDVEKWFDLGKRDDFKKFADAATEKAAAVKKALDAQKAQINNIKDAIRLLDGK